MFKAISTLVVVLIFAAVTIVAGVMVATWSTTIISKSLEAKPVTCINSLLEVTNLQCTNNNITFKIRNIGFNPLWDLKAKASIGDNPISQSYTIYTSNNTLKLRYATYLKLPTDGYAGLLWYLSLLAGNCLVYENRKLNVNCIGWWIQSLLQDWQNTESYNLNLTKEEGNVTLDSDAVLILNFDEGTANESADGQTTYDASNYGNNGTISGANWTTEGKFGSALGFDGSGDYIKIPVSNTHNIYNNIALEVWVKPALSTPSTRGNIIFKYQGPSPYTYGLHQGTDGKIYFTINSVANSVNSTTALNVGEWYHIVGTYDRNYMKLYVNGNLKSQKLYSSAIEKQAADVPVYIGSYESWQEFFNGTIDSVNIYPRALSQDEIIAHNNSATAPINKYLDNGNLTSPIKDTGSKVNLQKIKWTEPYKYGDELEAIDGIVGLWHFNNNDTSDSSPYGNDGVQYGGVNCTSEADGKFSNGCVFNGVDSYINISDPSLDINTGTIEAWFKEIGNEHEPGWKRIVNLDENFNIYEFSNSIRGRVITDNYDVFLIGSAINLNEWYYVALTYSGSAARLYLNGIEVASNTTVSGNIKTITTSLIGKRPTALDYFNGTIDEVAIYNRALNASEIYDHYMRGAANLNFQIRTSLDNSTWSEFSGADYTHSADANLVGAWDFSEMQENTTKDESGKGNTGTLGGGNVTRMPSWTYAGKHGSALIFDGLDDLVEINESTGLDLTTVTIEAWIYPKNITGYHDAVCKVVNWSNYEYCFGVNSGKVYAYFENNDVYTIVSGGSMTTNQWYHIATTFSGYPGTTKVYLDGIEVDLVSTNAPIVNTDVPVYIGIIGNSLAAEFFNGTIDSVAIYNRALKAWEIQKHANDRFTTAAGEKIGVDNTRYLQYRAFLSTSDTNVTSKLEELTINYSAT